jgi:hypothetical protein
MSMHRPTYGEKYQLSGYATPTISEFGNAPSTSEEELVYDPECATASTTHRPSK